MTLPSPDYQRGRETLASKCRVPGCIALAAPPPRICEMCYLGVCVGHQKLPADDLRWLLKHGGPQRVELKPIGGIEYERADGSQYGIDHDGNYYDVRPATRAAVSGGFK